MFRWLQSAWRVVLRALYRRLCRSPSRRASLHRRLRLRKPITCPRPSTRRRPETPSSRRTLSGEHPMKTSISNTLNLDAPPSAPSPSAPGKLREKNNKVDHEQRGEPAFKGDDSNKQSSADQEFSHYCYDVNPEFFLHALYFEYYKPGNFKRVKEGPHGDGFIFKKHGAVEYFPQ
eukprot:12293584-Alexandrium_andersonii.AAC.1